MNRETFLKCWYDELERFSPRLVGEEYNAEKFRSSPMVQSCLVALEVTQLAEMPDSEIDTSDIPETNFANAIQGVFHLTKDGRDKICEMYRLHRASQQDLLILEENLKTCLELKSLAAIPRTIVQQVLDKVQKMKKGDQ